MAKKEKIPTGVIGGLEVGRLKDKPVFNKFLVYGLSGSGKTRLAGSSSAVPSMGKVLFIDVEGGTSTLRNCYPDVDVVRVTKFRDLYKVYSELFDGETGYKTVVIDSLSEVQKLDMMGIMSDVAASNPKMIEEVPSTREYLISLEHMRKLIRAFRDLPMNVIITCLAEQGRDQSTGKKYVSPLLTGKFSTEVQAFFDQVFYLYAVEDVDDDGESVSKRMLLTGTYNDIIAKDRSGSLPLIIHDPTMELINNYINN